MARPDPSALVPSYVRRVRGGASYMVCLLRDPETGTTHARGWVVRTERWRQDRAAALKAAWIAYRDGASDPPRLRAQRPPHALMDQPAVHLAELFGLALCGATPEASVPTSVWLRHPAWVEKILATWRSRLCAKCRTAAKKRARPPSRRRPRR